MYDLLPLMAIFISIAVLVILTGVMLWRAFQIMSLMYRVKRHFKAKVDRSVTIFRYLDGQNDATDGGDWYGSIRNWIQDVYEQSGVKYSLPQIYYASILFALLIATASIATGHHWLLLLLPILLPAPILLLKFYSRRKNSRISAQLPAVFSAISRMVKSGQTVQAAMRVVAEDFPDPVRSEFLQCYEQQNLGATKEHALRRLAARTGIIELRMFAVAIMVQNRFGGDLSELLQSLADINRNRLTLKQRVHALTAEGRMQALVLAILPLASFGAILITNPNYIAPLLDHPKLIGATILLQLVGIVWILKIVRADY